MGLISEPTALIEDAEALLQFEARAAELGLVDRLPLEEARKAAGGELRLIRLAMRKLLAQSLDSGKLVYRSTERGRGFLTALEDSEREA